MPFLLKTLLTALLVAAISELSKRSTLFAALLASLPLTSILAMIWLYRDTGDSAKISALSTGILWMVIPSLVFFVALPLLLRAGLRFEWSMLASCVVTALAYAGFMATLKALGVDL